MSTVMSKSGGGGNFDFAWAGTCLVGIVVVAAISLSVYKTFWEEKPTAAVPVEQRGPEFTKRSVLTVDAREGRVTVGNDRGFIADVEDLYGYNEEVYRYALELADKMKKAKDEPKESEGSGGEAKVQSQEAGVNVTVEPKPQEIHLKVDPSKSDPIRIDLKLELAPGAFRLQPAKPEVQPRPQAPPSKPQPAQPKSKLSTPAKECGKTKVVGLTKAVARENCAKCHTVSYSLDDPKQFWVNPRVTSWRSGSTQESFSRR